MFFPILIGSVVNTAFAFPIRVILSAIYPATSSFVIMSSFGAILKSPAAQTKKTEIENKVSTSMILLTLFGILVNRLLTILRHVNLMTVWYSADIKSSVMTDKIL